jgi:hypothetical protein
MKLRAMPSSDSKNYLPVVLFGLLVALWLACDFLMAPILATVQGRLPRIPGFPLLLSVVGSTLAQGCLLAAWLAWGGQPFLQRLRWHWIVATILYLVWAAGLALSHPRQFAEASSIIGLSVPLVSIGAQTPLWIARQAFGWRLIRGEEKNGTDDSPLSIRDLMMATVLVALSLALARLAPKLDNGERGIPWIIMFVVASTSSAIALLPAGALLLRTQRFQRGMLCAGLYAAFWVGLLWLVVLVAWSRGLFPPPPPILLIGISCLILSFAATVILAAAAARARGYRLVSGRHPRRSGDSKMSIP